MRTPDITLKSIWRTAKRNVICSLGLLTLLNVGSLLAQPSGGPYGPIPQTWAIPEVSGTIYYVAPNGDANSKGTTLAKPTTIEAAFERVVTGDAIIMRGGTYRTGDLFLNQGILIQPYLDERPVMMGTKKATEWEALRDGVWATSWDRLFPDEPQDWWRYEREAMRTPMHKFNNDMVFVDGKYLQSAGWLGELDENKFFINYDLGRVYIGVDPTDRDVEITAYNVAIHRVLDEVHGKKADDRGFTMRGIELTKYAYRIFEIDGYNPEGLSAESEHGKDVVGITLEHCTMSFGSRVAGYFRGDSLTIRHCKVSDTNTEGIFILSSNDVLLERNIIARNNIENMTGYYPSAVKIFNQCYRVVCTDNYVIDNPNSNGIWYDVGNIDGIFINNWLEDVGHNAFFFEISKGAICAGNVFVNCGQGVWVLNASDVEMYNNTFINSTIAITRTPRSAAADHFGWHPATGPDVDERVGNVIMNNLMVETRTSHNPLVMLTQSPQLCDKLTDSQVKLMDNNAYFLRLDDDAQLIQWSPIKNDDCRKVYSSLTDFRKSHPKFSASSLSFDYRDNPIFRSVAHSNLDLLPGFPGHKAAGELPANVKELLGIPEGAKPYIGAFRE